MATTGYKRRRYLTQKGLQFRYMSLIAVSMSVTAIVVGSLLYIDIWGAVIPEFSEAKLAEKLDVASQLQAYEEARAGRPAPRMLSLFREAQLLSAHERAAVSQILAAANARLAPRILWLILALCAASVLVSHRIAGPLDRLRKAMQAVSEADLTVGVALRRDDELKDLAGALEVMVRCLRSRIRHVMTSVQELSGELNQVHRLAGERSECAQLLGGLKTRLNQLERDLSVFKLS